MKGKKILVVDDNPMNVELISDLLEANGYHMLKAEEAETGIIITKKEMPDLILMDVQLPGMDGLTATGILKKDEATRNIPIIALTAHAMKGDEVKILGAGCDGYISKPIDTRKFPQTVALFLADK